MSDLLFVKAPREAGPGDGSCRAGFRNNVTVCGTEEQSEFSQFDLLEDYLSI